MSEMVERVAAAIRNSEKYWWNRDDEPEEGLAETLARTALDEVLKEVSNLADAGGDVALHKLVAALQ